MATSHPIKPLYILFKKELMSYFNSPIAYIFIAIFLIVGNWLFFNFFFLNAQASLRSYFSILPWIFLFLAPSLTMRLWSEEKKSGTVEFLLTLPISNWQIVLAKFFSVLVFLIITLLLSLSLPITVARLGHLDLGPVVGGYLGAILLGGAYLALGLFISSLTKNQIIAFISSLVAAFVLFVIGADFITIGLPNGLALILKHLSLGSHFDNIARGVIDTKDLVYYFSFIFLFLWLNVKVIEGRKWQ